MHIRSVAPNRIDLAGGTLDIHPLYVFEGEAVTVNLAIDIRSHVEIQTRSDMRVLLRSVDFGSETLALDVDSLPIESDLDLLTRAVRFYRPPCGIEMATFNQAPRGSGLGASSALLMAMSAALARLADVPLPGDTIIDWGANLEARNLGIPTGKQDYFAAVYGGLSAIRFDVRGAHREAIAVPPGFLEELERHLVLSFTGVSHFSGTNNWAMMKRYIDSEGDTVARMRAIKATAHAMRDALAAGDIKAVAGVLAEEWENRKGLAEGVTTPGIDAMVASAQEAGALASKICGAGGGGCMVTIAGDGHREQVEAALAAHGARVLPFHIDTSGLQVEVAETVEGPE